MVKYLVIGSAPYIQKWYAENGQDYLDAGYKLVAINNAWVLDFPNLYMWSRSADFAETGTFYPTRRIIKELNSKLPENIIGEFDGKYSYDTGQGTGTMFLNVIIMLLDKAIKDKKRLEICIAGCDFNYDKETNHFYGSGTADPLRYGKEWLIKELNRIKGFFELEGFKIYNVGGREKTLLPYERKTLCGKK